MLQSCERNVFILLPSNVTTGGSDKKPRKEKKGLLKKSQFNIRVL